MHLLWPNRYVKVCHVPPEPRLPFRELQDTYKASLSSWADGRSVTGASRKILSMSETKAFLQFKVLWTCGFSDNWCVCVYLCVHTCVCACVCIQDRRKHRLHTLSHWLLQIWLFYLFMFSSLALNGNINRNMPRRVAEQGLNYRDLCPINTPIICPAEWFSRNPARFPKKAPIWDDVMPPHPLSHGRHLLPRATVPSVTSSLAICMVTDTHFII